MAGVFLADLAPPSLLLLGPVLVALGVVHVRTAYWWYDWLTPTWRESEWKRLAAAINRWGGAGFLVAMGVWTFVVGVARMS